MAHSKQAKKRIRQNDKLRVHNKSMASAMRSSVKKVLAMVAEGDKAGAEAALPLACQRIDKAAKNNVIHKNNAARKKSRITRAVGALK